MKRILIIAVVVLIVGAVAFRLASVKKHVDEKKKVKEEVNFTVAVNVAPAQSRMSEENLDLVGTVVANEIIDIKAVVQGNILNVDFKLGDYVKQGQVLAHIDSRIRQLAVSNSEVALANAEQNFERYKNLYEGGAASKSQYDQYKLSYDNAKIQLDQSRKELGNTSVTAPITGYITEKNVEIGAYVSVGNSIATIVDVSKLKVKVNIPEREVYALKIGDVVNIGATVYPGVVFKGKITFISFNGDEAHNYPVEISIENQSKNPLKSGTYVDIMFNQKSKIASLQIPREALVGSIKAGQVYVVDASNKAHLRDILIGHDNGKYLEVLKGLKEGELVVTSGQINLKDGSPVSVIKQ